MEGYSLEEDDANSLFITQEVSKNVDVADFGGESDEELFNFGGEVNGAAADGSVNVPHYSDISDDEKDFEWNSTQ